MVITASLRCIMNRETSTTLRLASKHLPHLIPTRQNLSCAALLHHIITCFSNNTTTNYRNVNHWKRENANSLGWKESEDAYARLTGWRSFALEEVVVQPTRMESFFSTKPVAYITISGACWITLNQFPNRGSDQHQRRSWFVLYCVNASIVWKPGYLNSCTFREVSRNSLPWLRSGSLDQTVARWL